MRVGAYGRIPMPEMPPRPRVDRWFIVHLRAKRAHEEARRRTAGPALERVMRVFDTVRSLRRR